jgi:GTP cyclohydrolase III
MINFRDLIPWPRATDYQNSDYQKLSEEFYQEYQQEKQERQAMAKDTKFEFSFSVGPSISFDDGAAITFKQTGGLTTTVELGYKHVRTLVNLLETVMESVGEDHEQ